VIPQNMRLPNALQTYFAQMRSAHECTALDGAPEQRVSFRCDARPTGARLCALVCAAMRRAASRACAKQGGTWAIC
jgi:hypothetical protein